IPVDILVLVVGDVLAGNRREFQSIRSFSLASRLFRHIALKLYFTKLRLTWMVKAGRVFNIPDSAGWVRYLASDMHIMTSQALSGCNFTALTKLEINCVNEHKGSAMPQMSLLAPVLPPLLTELKLVSLPCISRLMLQKISDRCRELAELELSVAERIDVGCCWLCFEESQSCSTHSPVPGVYDSAEDLASDFGDALRPLTRLRRLSLGIFLSEEGVLSKHTVDHSSRWEAYRFFGRAKPDYSLPLHDLDDCEHDETVTSSSVFTPAECVKCSDEHSRRVRMSELNAAIKLAQRLKGLESVRWTSWWTIGPLSDEFDEVDWQEGDDGGAGWSEIWIRRREGRVRVKREPWGEC
ncbi:hypothetical protein FA95DRAFT_1654324, partial [Auriscalpium vulgare]